MSDLDLAGLWHASDRVAGAVARVVSDALLMLGVMTRVGGES